MSEINAQQQKKQQSLYDGAGDEQFARPYVDEDEMRDKPARHRYIHGGFEGTQTRFCFYFPEKEAYADRFFQPLSPVVGDEREAQFQEDGEGKLLFALTHGAYLVESNLGGIVNGGDDPTLLYRACTACAQFSRKLAAEYYGEHRPFGYVFGGSGGGFKTISCAESTEGIWDGAVPFVIGSPVAMPNVFTVRAHAMRILRYKMEEIKDALEPGGSGDPYACLNEEEAAALREAELMGFPMETWCVYDTIGEGALPVLTPGVMAIDPTYCRDFWEQPGYLGTDPQGSAVRDRIVIESEIVRVLHPERGLMGIADSIDEKNAYGVDEAWKHIMGHGKKLPVFALDRYPQGDFYRTGMKVRFVSGALEREQFGAICLTDNCITIDVGMDPRDLEMLLQKAQPGDRVVLDNSDYIALQTYHRHQVPGTEFHAWDQFRGADGAPLYPQRPVQAGPVLAQLGAGSVQSGTPHCKMIILESLMDESAFPWQADWYRGLIREKAGGAEIEDRTRLWYMEHCMHTDCEEGNGGDHQHIVSYSGALYQALLDLSDWVERGVQPAASSGYTMEGGKVHIPESAAERKGVQPVVSLTADGAQKREIRIGETVEFTACVQLPEGGGEVELMLWDFEGSGEFLPGGEITARDGSSVTIVNRHTFHRSGTHFPVVKIASNRNAGDVFTRIYNQVRVRVIVTESES
ncbi:MAG: hypothetical protein Q4C60_07010 [Eubacteriales bacterium]|nr:hypothetical protein [Eubacteriales bacterium]